MTPVIGLSCSTVPRVTMAGMLRYSLPCQYVECVARADGLPWILPNLDPSLVPAYLERLDGLLLTGGDDLDPTHYGQPPHPSLILSDPDQDVFELALARAAWEADLPVFAICRGGQVLNVALGGNLLQDVPSQVEGAVGHDQGRPAWRDLAHEVDIVPGTRLHGIAGAERVRVNSFHHQAVDRVAEGFLVTARAADGVVEGMEDPGRHFCLAVQWHPERRPDDPLTRDLFRAFTEAARGAMAPKA